MTSIPHHEEPLIIAIGGGKGGVGKSMISSNLAVQYAQAGLKVILIDLDIGAANLHTIFGLRQPPKSLGEYFSSSRSQLKDFLVTTSVDNLQLVSSSGFVPELANIQHQQRVKLIQQIKELTADVVLLDLGAGTALNVIDFFSMTHAGIVVTTPEPTALVNAYEFLKNVVYRILFRMFRNQPEVTAILKVSILPNNELQISTIDELARAIEKDHRWAAEQIRAIFAELDLHLIFNQARRTSDVQRGAKLNQISQRFLGVTLSFAGMVFYNEEVSASVHKMCPISLLMPDSVTSQGLKRIALSIFQRMAKKLLDRGAPASFEAQLSDVQGAAQRDFAQNLLVQRRHQREASKETT